MPPADARKLPPDERCRRRSCVAPRLEHWQSGRSPASHRLKSAPASSCPVNCKHLPLWDCIAFGQERLLQPIATSEDFSVFHAGRQICFPAQSDFCCGWFPFRLRRPVRETRRISVSEETDSSQWRGDHLGAIV